MKQETLSAFDQILKAAQEKAAGKTVLKSAQPATPAPKQTQAPAKKDIGLNETPKTYNTLSDITAAAEMETEQSPGFCIPQPFALPAMKQTQPEPAPKPAAENKIQVIDYSEKAFAVTGDGTKTIKQDLASMGGKPNWNLKNIGFGWIFSKKKLEEVKLYLQNIAA